MSTASSTAAVSRSAAPRYQPTTQPLLHDRFDGLAGLVNDYVRAVPPLPHADQETDRFVAWVQEQSQIDAEQRDWLLCLYSRRAVEMAALHKRLAHARFTELVKNSPAQHALPSAAVVCLNPVHVWATFQTRLFLEDDCDIPAHALFYQVHDEVHSAVLHADVQRLVRGLEHRNLTLMALLREFFPGDELTGLAVVHELARRGIVAFRHG